MALVAHRMDVVRIEFSGGNNYGTTVYPVPYIAKLASEKARFDAQGSKLTEPFFPSTNNLPILLVWLRIFSVRPLQANSHRPVAKSIYSYNCSKLHLV